MVEGVPCIRILIVPKFQKNWFWWWLNLILVLDVLRSYRFGLSHQRVNRKPFSCSGGFNWGVLYFDSCITILMAGKALMVFSFESRRSSPLYRLEFFNQSLNRKDSVLSRRLGWKDVGFLPCNRNLMVRIFQRVLCILFNLDIGNLFLLNFGFDLLHQVRNRIILSSDKLIE